MLPIHSPGTKSSLGKSPTGWPIPWLLYRLEKKASVAAGVRSWREEMKRAIRDPCALCQLLELPATLAEAARRASQDFPLFVPHPLLARMTPGDPADPLLRQVLPVSAELRPVAGFCRDPVHDLSAQWRPGVIHKYRGLALMIASGACAVHCRYCFRRFFSYHERPRSPVEWEPTLLQLCKTRSWRK